MHSDLESSPLHSKPVYIYAFYAPEIELLKLGLSRDPKKRFGEVRDNSPVDVQLVGYCRDLEGGRLEALIHAYLQPHRVRGEWFREHPDTRMIVNLIASNRPAELSKAARTGFGLIDRKPQPDARQLTEHDLCAGRAG